MAIRRSRKSKLANDATETLIAADSRVELEGCKLEMEAQGFTGSEILWGEVTQEFYQWWYRKPLGDQVTR